MHRNIKCCLLLILALALFFRLFQIRTVGELWDEAAVAETGTEYLKLIAHGEFSKSSWLLNREHPPIAKYIYGATKLIPKYSTYIARLDSQFPVGRHYLSGRVLSVVIGIACLYLVYLLSSKLFSWKVGLLAGLFYALSPTLIAHNRVNGIETPLILWCLLLAYSLMIMQNKKRLIWSGIFLGLIMATRYNGFLLLPIIPIAQWVLPQKSNTNKKVLLSTIIILTIAGVVFIVSWPYLWSNPVVNLMESMRLSSTPTNPEFFLGLLQHPPFYYYFFYLIITTPLPILIGLILSALFSKHLVKNNKPAVYILCSFIVLVFNASFFPLKQDGIRYVIHALPFLYILSALGWIAFLDSLRFRLCKVQPIVLAGLIIGCALIYSNLKVHPYQLDYYNCLIGGPQAVYHRRLADFGWWGEGIYEAITYINKNAPLNSTLAVGISPQHVAPEIRSDIIFSAGDLDGDYVVINTYAAFYQKLEVFPVSFSPIHEVTVAGVPLATVYRRNE